MPRRNAAQPPLIVPALITGLIEQIVTAISGYRYRHGTEGKFQDGIEEVLFDAGLEAEREVSLTPRDRIDFMVGSIGIEAKIKGTKAEVARQLTRYAECPEVEALLLVTTRAQLRMPDTSARGKPIRTVYINPLA